MKMTDSLAQSAPSVWPPILIVVLGFCLGTLLGVSLFYSFEVYYHSLNAIREHLSWIAFLVVFGLAVLFAVIVRIALLAKHQAIYLDKINHELIQQMTERARAEESKQQLEVALLQGQKLQAIGTLAGGIAHDFNNILYAIMGYTEMSRQDVEKDTLLYQNLGKVLEGAERGRELVSRILSFSRRQHHQFSVIQLKSTIEAALSLLNPTVPSSVMIHFTMAEEVEILGNQTQMHQVFVNLINNAVDAMDGEGTIDISVSSVTLKDNRSFCKIELKDTGHGMDTATMSRIFEPFYTTKEVGKGTGLGLSIVHSIIKEHEGEISVTSQLGHGTTFTILLPEHQTE